MTGLVIVILACLGSAAVVAVVAPTLAPEVVAGMLGPLVAVAASWALVKRTARVNPGRVQAVMVGGFIVKLVFFGGYVAAVVRLSGLRAELFAGSFVMYFVALYATEAVMLKRLFAGATRSGPTQ